MFHVCLFLKTLGSKSSRFVKVCNSHSVHNAVESWKDLSLYSLLLQCLAHVNLVTLKMFPVKLRHPAEALFFCTASIHHINQFLIVTVRKEWWRIFRSGFPPHEFQLLVVHYSWSSSKFLWVFNDIYLNAWSCSGGGSTRICFEWLEVGR